MTPSLASVLRVSPALGRWFTDEEGVPGAARVAVLSHGLWVRRFGGDAAILGRSVMLTACRREVDRRHAGVVRVSRPARRRLDAGGARARDGLRRLRLHGVARLRDGVTLDDARAELDALIAELPQVYPEDPPGRSATTCS